MKEDKTTTKISSGKENEPVVENGKKKGKEERPATKVVVRRLPPSMTEDQFKLQVSPLPEIDYLYFVSADMSLMPNAFSRAYINFVDQSDLFIFTQKFDGYVFVDSKGGEFPAVVEFAPFQRIPRNRPSRKKDPKVGTIESDPIFIAFKERLETEIIENRSAVNASKQHFFETSLITEKKEMNNTPLLDYIKKKREERQRIREEKREEKRKKDLERRRAKEEQRRTKKDEDNSVLKVLNTQTTSKDRPKEKEVKPSFIKKKSDESKIVFKERTGSELRTKETKTRTGKSYLEERQRQAERREEQRKKLSQNSQSSTSLSEVKASQKSEEKGTTSAEEKQLDELPSAPDSKGKDSEFKKPEKIFKREDLRRSSYKYDKYEKYDTKRDRESDDPRKTRRINNERSYQSSRRDDERAEDGSRKRYSEARRSHESAQRDRYRDKNKLYGQKKTPTTSEVDKGKISTDNSNKPVDDGHMIKEESQQKLDVKEDNESLESNNTSNEVSHLADRDVTVELKENEKSGTKAKSYEPKDKYKPTRRKSLDIDKTRSSSAFSNSKSYTREKYLEKKRRNSFGSTKHYQDNSEFNFQLGDNENPPSFSKSIVVSDLKITSEKGSNETQTKDKTNGDSSAKERNLRAGFEDKDRELPKRRNSTGERQDQDKISPRRNSLGSNDNFQLSKFKEPKSEEAKFEDKSKENKVQENNRDPRTGRRIRNKDRPSLEIYRPGMGKFSKQRKEREKGLGSSTEVDSPSSSPSPTPVLKHKTLTPH